MWWAQTGGGGQPPMAEGREAGLALMSSGCTSRGGCSLGAPPPHSVPCPNLPSVGGPPSSSDQVLPLSTASNNFLFSTGVAWGWSQQRSVVSGATSRMLWLDKSLSQNNVPLFFGESKQNLKKSIRRKKEHTAENSETQTRSKPDFCKEDLRSSGIEANGPLPQACGPESCATDQDDPGAIVIHGCPSTSSSSSSTSSSSDSSDSSSLPFNGTLPRQPRPQPVCRPALVCLGRELD